jgi:hypothetical protein
LVGQNTLIKSTTPRTRKSLNATKQMSTRLRKIFPWGDEHGGVVAIPEVWSARSFWEWNVKPNVLVTIDEERHKQNLLEINQAHMWGTIKFWRHMLEHEAKEHDIKVVQSFGDAVLYLNENKSKKYQY